MFQRLAKIVGLDLNYFIKGGFWLVLSTIFTTLGGLFLSSIFSKVWPSDVFGQYSLLLSAVGFISLTSLPGLNQMVVQEVALGKDGVYLASIKNSLKWSILGSLLLVLGAAFFYFRNNPNLAIAFLAFATAFPLSYGLNLYLSYFNGRGNFKILSLLSIISQLLPTVIIIIFLFKLPSLVWIAFITAWTQALINLILTLLSLKWVRNKKNNKHAISFGKKISFSTLIFAVTDYIDKFFITLFLGYNFLAVYVFAITIPMQLHNLFKIFLTLAQPKIASLSKKNIKKNLFKKTLLFEALILFIVGSYIILAPLIFQILYPNYKESATLPSQLFALSLLYFPSNLFGIANIQIKSTKNLYFGNIVYTISTILPLVILTPLFGILGVVVAKIISRIILIVFQFYMFKKLYD